MKDFPFNLQLFADDGGDGGTGDTGTDTETVDKGTEETKPDEESKVIPETEVQDRINKALNDAKAKWEKEYQKKAEKAKKERERLSKLSEDERAKEELENSRKELEAKEAELTKKELKLEMVKVLAERKIPVEFMDYLVDKDSESTLARITTFEKAYKKAIKDGVNEKLKGTAPQAGSNNKGAKSTGVKNGFFEAIYKNQVKR